MPKHTPAVTVPREDLLDVLKALGDANALIARRTGTQNDLRTQTIKKLEGVLGVEYVVKK